MRANEVVRNVVKEKLARNEVVASMTIRLTRGVEIARLAKTAGFDMIYIDLEHSTMTLDMTGQICLAALSAGIAPMVRVPANTPEYIQRVLDGGALGIVAPGIRSAEEAREVVKAVKFAPLGERGAGGALPHLEYRSFPTAEANAAVNDATMVIVQFESAEAVEKADEIAAVEGVDMVLIGVNDMLASMGLAGQLEHPKVRDAYARTIAACRKHGKHVGVGGLSTKPKLAAEFVAMGARMVSTGTDIQFLLAAMTEKAKQVREIPVVMSAADNQTHSRRRAYATRLRGAARRLRLPHAYFWPGRKISLFQQAALHARRCVDRRSHGAASRAAYRPGRDRASEPLRHGQCLHGRRRAQAGRSRARRRGHRRHHERPGCSPTCMRPGFVACA